MIRTVYLPLVFAVLLCAINCADAQATDWTQFRGEQFGHADAKLPVEFAESKNVAWKTAIPGEGHSSPVVIGNSIWLTAAVESKLTEAEEKERLAKVKNPRNLKLAGKLSLRAICVDGKSGAIKHNIELFEINEPEPKHQLNSYASPTPVISGKQVYCHFGTYGTAALDAETGSVTWKSDELHCDHQNGPGSSPIVWNDLLIAHHDGIDEQFVAALHKADGSVAWKQKRTSPMNAQKEFRKAYCTPVIVEHDGQPVLISPGADWVYGYNPATGKEIWRAHYGQLGFSTVPRPVIANGMVYICTSYLKSRLLAVKYDGEGDVTDTHIAWTSDSNVPKKPSILVVKDKLFMIADNGVVTCLDAITGKQVWRQRLDGNFSASPIFANGNIYFFSQEGKAVVIKAGDKFEEVASNQLDAGFMASPAVVDDAMILRTETHLYRVETSATGK